MPFAELEKYGFQLYYKYICEEYSGHNKPLVLFLHEGLGSVAQWKDFPVKLCEMLRLPGLLYDRCGYGRSSPMGNPHPGDYLLYEGKIILLAFLKKIKEKRKLLLVGHSDGGTIALVYASFYPKNTTLTITEAAHVFVEKITVKGILEAVKSYESGSLKKALQKYHGEKTDFIFHNWADTWTGGKMAEWNIECLLGNVRCPVLALQGMDDQYGSEDQVESIVKNTGGYAEGFLLPSCGHIPHFQSAELTINHIYNFLKLITKNS